MNVLETIFSGDYSAHDLLIAAGVAAIVLIVVSRHFQIVDCVSCGWRGEVSRYAGRCPQCNQPLGERKAQHRA